MSHRRTRERRRVLLPAAGLILLLVMMLAGCATSSMKHVQAVDSSERTVKLLYSQYINPEVGYKRGVIECDLEQEELTNCRELEVEYR